MVLTRSGMVQKAAMLAVCAVMGSGTVFGATVGYSSQGSSSFTTGNRMAQLVTLTSNGELTSISFYHSAGGTGKNIILGVYDNWYYNSNNYPGARLGTTITTPIATSNGWQTIPLIKTIRVASGQKVWLAFMMEETNRSVYRKNCGTGKYAAATNQTSWTADNMPAVFNINCQTVSTLASDSVSIYANYIPDYIWDNNGVASIFTTSTNKVGIGTSTINSMLQVADNAAIGYSASTSAPANGLAVSSMVCIGTVNAPGANGKLLVNGGAAIGYSAAGTNPPTNGLVVSGSVGIGTSPNTGKLDVDAETNALNGIHATANASGYYAIYAEGGSGSAGAIRVYARGSGTGISVQTQGGLAGDFGGDVTVSGKLKINSWTLEAPDYVFERDYKLPSLKEVEKQITTHKHLPDMPSAAEMKKNGMDLTEMNMKLLKKVEELTLYVIAQNKKIEALEKKGNEKK